MNMRRFASKFAWLPALYLLFGALAGCQSTIESETTAATASPPIAPVPTTTPSPDPTNTFTLPSATASPTATATPSEPAGCLEPIDDYAQVTVNGYTLNKRTMAMLEHAAGLYGGEIDITGWAITQGSYSGSVFASFGTHSGGGAVDLAVMRTGTWTVVTDEIEPLVQALRVAGFAAWLREVDEVEPGSGIHIHAIAIGDEELSSAAQEQLTGEYGYFRGYNGLPEDRSHDVDRHGGPVLCDWMRDAGYEDLRPTLPAERSIPID